MPVPDHPPRNPLKSRGHLSELPGGGAGGAERTSANPFSGTNSPPEVAEEQQ